MFGPFLGLRSFDIAKGPLVRKQTSFPITFDGVGLILTSIIAPTTYLRNRAFVISTIFARFMVDQCPFLFEALVGVVNNTFPFQQHLNNTCDFLAPPARACLFHLNNSLDNKWFNFEIPWIVYTIVPFLTCFSMRHLRPLCPNLILFWVRGRHLAYNSTNLLSLLIIFPNFLHNISYVTYIIPSSNRKQTLICVYTSHRPYGYPPFTLCSWRRTHWNP